MIKCYLVWCIKKRVFRHKTTRHSHSRWYSFWLCRISWNICSVDLLVIVSFTSDAFIEAFQINSLSNFGNVSVLRCFNVLFVKVSDLKTEPLFGFLKSNDEMLTIYLGINNVVPKVLRKNYELSYILLGWINIMRINVKMPAPSHSEHVFFTDTINAANFDRLFSFLLFFFKMEFIVRLFTCKNVYVQLQSWIL